MNKGELIEKVSQRLGDQKASSAAVDALVTEIENAVSMGDKVNISGFGTFEKRDRAARTGRNPRTGEPISVQQTSVPVFRPGQTFKTLVSGGQSGQPSGRAQASRGQTNRAQPARAQASRTQTARAQTSKTQSSRTQGTRAQSSRAQSSYAQGGKGQSSYSRQGAKGQSSYSRQSGTAQRQSSRARAK